MIHKKLHKILALSAVLVALAVAACEMVVEEINFPENAKAGTEVTMTVKIKLVTETDDNSNLIFALLVPKSWDLKNNASLTLTTSGYAAQGYPEVNGETLTLIPDSETEKSTALPYPQAYQSKIGVMGNTGPVEWTVYKSSTVFHINDKVSKDPIYGTITVKLKTGATPVKFFLGAGFCGSSWGLDTDDDESRYTPNETAKVVTVYGEEGETILDYTVAPAIYPVPTTFRYGDIFSVNYDAQGTALSGSENLYLCAKAVLADGTEKTVSEPGSSRTLMSKVSGTLFRKYIYPKDFFSLPANAEITGLYVWFSNADGSVIEKEGDDGHLLVQADE